MKARVSRLAIVSAAVVGFCVPFILVLYFLVLDSMFFFSAPPGTWRVQLLARWLPALLCPPLLMADEPGFWLTATPFMNALIYALIAYLYLKAKSLSMKEDRADGETSCLAP
jgi:hypothetical protein